jgi:hypothetical protein
MESPEQPDNTEIEKLIAIAQQKPAKGEEPIELGSVRQWIIACNIKPGDHVISPREVWFAYSKWATDPLNFPTFCKEFKKLFEQHRGRGSHANLPYYLVDPSAFDLSLDNLWEMRAKVREQRRKNNQRVKKTQG